MKNIANRCVCMGTGLSLLALFAAGCGGVDPENGEAADADGNVTTNQDELAWKSSWWRHRLAPAASGGAGNTSGAGNGTSGSGGAVSAGAGNVAPVDPDAGCEICARANACCEGVDGGALCTFSAQTCSAMDSVRKEAYVEGCKTLLQTILSVRTELPSACR